MHTGRQTYGLCTRLQIEFSFTVHYKLRLKAAKLTQTVAPRLGLEVTHEAVNSVTRGLVGDSSFAVLPDVVPLTCFLLTFGAQIVRQTSILRSSHRANK